jgi:hypothetical protein
MHCSWTLYSEKGHWWKIVGLWKACSSKVYRLHYAIVIEINKVSKFCTVFGVTKRAPLFVVTREDKPFLYTGGVEWIAAGSRLGAFSVFPTAKNPWGKEIVAQHGCTTW